MKSNMETKEFNFFIFYLNKTTLIRKIIKVGMLIKYVKPVGLYIPRGRVSEPKRNGPTGNRPNFFSPNKCLLGC